MRTPFVAATVLLTALACGSGNGPSTANTPQELFEHLLGDPNQVTDLKGDGDTWQGHSIYLRFSGDKSVVLDTSNYQKVPCNKLQSGFWKLDEGYKEAMPWWTPESVNKAKCFESHTTQNRWTNQGHSSVLTDINSDIIYFYEIAP